MKILLLGGSNVLLSLFEVLLEKDYIDSISIITSPRHANVKQDGTTFLDKITNALENSRFREDSHIYNFKSIENDEFIQICKRFDCRVSISAAWIYKKKYIEAAGPILQMHNTLLPEMRGGASYSWMIMSGIRSAATTLFTVDEGIDTGEIIMSKEYEFPITCKTPLDYMNYADKRAIKDLLEFIEQFNATKKIPDGSKQNENKASYFPRLHTLTNGCIDWGWERQEIIRFICAFDEPYIGAHTSCTRTEKKLFLRKASAATDETYFHPYQFGLIYNICGEKIFICCKGGGICVEIVCDEAKEDVAKKLLPGDRFYTSIKDLEESKSSRIYYGPQK